MLRRLLEIVLCAAVAFGASPGVPPFQLRDTRGAVHTPAEWSGQKAVLLFFVTTDCPIGNSYVPEMNRIRENYGPRGVAVYAVQGDTTVPAADVERYAKDYGYTFPPSIRRGHKPSQQRFMPTTFRKMLRRLV